MRKGLSLIELIFTIVIIALVFTVIPKVVFALKKSDSFAIRQDAILNSVSLMQMLSKLSWDEENVDTRDVLHVSPIGNPIFNCDPTSRLRVGGFVGSRDCLNNITVLIGNLGQDAGENNETDFDDIDDFNNFDFNTSVYNIHLTINYVNDFPNLNIPIDLSENALAVGSTNLKRVNLQTNYNGVRAGERGNALMDFNYTSANIGQTFFHKRVWR
jgi:prepilin-type N-terminal cleavage/methylation domain-containing protein